MARIVLNSVNENGTAYLVVSFYDNNNALSAPSSVQYRVDCLTTNTAVRTLTNVTPASQVQITLTNTDTAIINQANAKETKRVTIIATYGANDELPDEYDFEVKNLSGI